MSNPRRIVPRTTKFITRRTTRRFFLLNPDKKRIIWDIYWYVTALLAHELGIEIHAVQILSNHMHEVLTDTRGEIARFLQQRNRLFANALKVFLGWKEEVFARGGASCVDLYGADAILRQIAYTLANAVEAGLAHNPEDWPGVTHSATDIGIRKIRTDRPKLYFDPDNKRWPESAEITLTVPKELESALGGWDEARARIVKTVKRAVLKAREVARKAGRFLKSPGEIYATKRTTKASSPETHGERNPTFAAAGTPELAARALHDRRTFLSAYREAMNKVREGVLGVLFPPGTWRMHREFGFGISTS
jgi:REP element-mobilizing transposase RayT